MAEHFGIHSGYFHPVLRTWQQGNTKVTSDNLMYPIFISHNPNAREDIGSMEGVKRWGENTIVDHLAELVGMGLKSVLIFGVPDPAVKDERGSAGDDETKNPVIRVIQVIKAAFPGLLIACDVCLCTWTSHGHCGIIPNPKDGVIDNAKSIARLAEIALCYAKAGCHIVAPSDMMDGRILAIKNALKAANLSSRVSVLSYSAKFSSCCYGPFRDAAGSAPSFGDRKCYQLPVGSSGLAMRAVQRDIDEGADMLMVKPALMFLDILNRVKDKHPNFPLFAYQVSGEYSMLTKGAAAGLFDLDTALNESLVSMRRAGTDVIITYFAPRILKNLV